MQVPTQPTITQYGNPELAAFVSQTNPPTKTDFDISLKKEEVQKVDRVEFSKDYLKNQDKRKIENETIIEEVKETQNEHKIQSLQDYQNLKATIDKSQGIKYYNQLVGITGILA